MDLMANDTGDVLPTLSELDKEGRALVLDFGLFVLINVYCVADSADVRYHFKMNFYYMLQERVRILISEGREVIVLGDLNSCPAPIDHCEGYSPKYKDTFYSESPHRVWIRDWISESGPLVDIVRERWPNREGMFTCWNTKISARESNYGVRIDLILVTPGLRRWIKHGDIQASVKGSDHCPVYIDLYDAIVDEETGREITLASQLQLGGSPRTTIATTNDYQATTTTRTSGVTSGSETRETPRICARQWDEFSTKQTLLSAFFTKRTPSTTTTTTMGGSAEPVVGQSQDSSSAGDDDHDTRGHSPIATLNASLFSTKKVGAEEPEGGGPDGTDGLEKQRELLVSLTSGKKKEEEEEMMAIEDGSNLRVQPPPHSEGLGGVNGDAMRSVSSKEQEQDQIGKENSGGGDGNDGGLASSRLRRDELPQKGLSSRQHVSKKRKAAGSVLDDSGQFKKQKKVDKDKGSAAAAAARSNGQATLASFFQKPGRGAAQGGERGSGRESVRREKRQEQAEIVMVVVDDDDGRGNGDVHRGGAGEETDGSEDEQFRRDLELATALSQAQMRSSPGPSSPPSSPSIHESQERLYSATTTTNTRAAAAGKKEAWSTLMQPLQAPKCTVHGEPTKLLTVNKPGPNKGKTFYVCSR
ncbi:Class II abasic (AP) endonuclease, partial [Serendipita sp. 399]